MHSTILENKANKILIIISIGLFLVANLACMEHKDSKVLKSKSSNKIIAEAHNSGFELSHDTYNGLTTLSDGRIYYVLCSESYKVGGQMFRYDPETNSIKHLGDITEACGEKEKKTIPQGKVHVNFIERRGKAYFATHVGYYDIINGMEKIGKPPVGYKPYPGGHFVSYDMKTGKFDELAIAPHGDGILTMAMDTLRSRIYGITWPNGYFLRYDLTKGELKNLGQVAKDGENGIGDNYRTICRSISVDPRDGSAYFTNGDGDILRYNYDTDSIEKVKGADMRKDYFGQYDPSNSGHMAYNWRQTFWYEPENVIYGVHGNSGYLFRFDPSIPRVEIVERITSEPSKRCGMFDQFSYGYLGFKLGIDGRTIYYLTGGPIYIDGKRIRGKDKLNAGGVKGLENLHLVTFDIPDKKYTDNGPIFFADGGRPSWVNSIAIGKNGVVYTQGRFKENGKTRIDLISIPGPFKFQEGLN